MVNTWTGSTVKALRQAMRMSQLDFAAHLGVADRTVSYWEASYDSRPSISNQGLLDAALEQASQAEVDRFQHAIDITREVESGSGRDGVEVDDWNEDIADALQLAASFEFEGAQQLLRPWLGITAVSDVELELRARMLMVLGDIARDRGTLHGPGAAGQYYTAAWETCASRQAARGAADAELALAVIAEMSGHVEDAARLYSVLSTDGRLSRRSRNRARLWQGTALTKHGVVDAATQCIRDALCRFSDGSHAADWVVAMQKLALSHRSAGDLDLAGAAVEQADRAALRASPLQRTKLLTARGHILISDRASEQEGRLVLRQARELSQVYQFGHQQRSIDALLAGGVQ